MPFSKNLNTYADIEAVLQACRKTGQNRFNYKLETRGLAVNWRARAYYYRTLLRQQAEARLSIPGFQPSTPWDDMTLELAPGSSEVVIRFGVNITGQLSIAGAPVEIGPVTMPEPVTEMIRERLEIEVDEETARLEQEARDILSRMGVE